MSNSKYLPNLDGLRCVYAVAIAFVHLEMVTYFAGLTSAYQTQYAGLLAQWPVLIVWGFFVLSGFLISRLLFLEEASQRQVDIPYFYARRLLRTWGPYFLTIALAVLFLKFLPIEDAFQIPGEVQGWRALAYFLFLSHLPMLGAGVFPGLGHFWSLAVEEHFYLIWPWVFRFLKSLWVEAMLVAFFAKVFLNFYLLEDQVTPLQGTLLKTLISSFRIECFAVGALFGFWSLHRNTKFFDFLRMPFLAVVSVMTIVVAFFFPKAIFSVSVYFYIWAMGLLIFQLGLASKWRGLELPFFRYFGRRSYGLYIYHLPIYGAVVTIMKDEHPLIVRLTMLATLCLVTILSYRFFERPLLDLKPYPSAAQS